jgi:hypothetical protein
LGQFDYHAKPSQSIMSLVKTMPREPVMVPTLDPVMVPALEPVMVPALEPVIVPALDPVIVPALDPVIVPALDPVIVPVPAKDAVERESVSAAVAIRV